MTKLDKEGFEIVEIRKKKLNKLLRVAIGFQNQAGLACHAFTNYWCLSCDLEFTHPNTKTPHVCPLCTKVITADYIGKNSNLEETKEALIDE